MLVLVDDAFGLVFIVLIKTIDRDLDFRFREGFEASVDLGDATIDENEIGIRQIFLFEPLISTEGDFFHRVVIIAGVGILKMEFPVHSFCGFAIDVANHGPMHPGPVVLNKYPQIGSDEVGTGDVFGPICVCAAYVEEAKLGRINELGVTDSKKMSDEYILQIGPLLIKEFDYSQLSLPNDKYNEIHGPARCERRPCPNLR